MTDAIATSPQDPATERRRGAIRLAVGLAQGVLLVILIWLRKRPLPAQPDPAAWAAMLFAVGFAPMVVLGGMGRLRLPVLLGSAAALGAAAAWFGWHAVARGIGTWGYEVPQLPPAEAYLLTAAFVFIGHHLVAGAEAARRWIAPHDVYFDIAWKNGVQLALSLAFTGLLWAGLWLGAALFDLIGVKGFERLLQDDRVIWPVTGVAFAGAVQLTDVRLGLIRGIRTVGLALLSWLLPLMTLIVVAFLLALPVTGLAPLFATRSAAGLLLGAAAGLIVLINAAYQTGDAAQTPAVLRWAARIAAVSLTPLVAVAAYALAQRVGQHGWTPGRVTAAACALAAAGYAAGYLIAAFARTWMRPLERTNVVLALAGLILLLGLMTPIADPARLSVADQVARLLDGRTPLARFDFNFIEVRGGRYGRDAMAALKALHGDTRRLAIAQAAKSPPRDGPLEAPVLPLERRVVAVYPAGARLPAEFLPQKRAAQAALAGGALSLDVTRDIAFGDAECLRDDAATCDAYVLDIDGDGHPEVLVAGVTAPGQTRLAIFKRDARGHWPSVGSLWLDCAASVDALRAGRFTVQRSVGADLLINGVRYTPGRRAEETCADGWPKAPLADY